MIARPPRAALRYYGGKWRLADWIVGHLPTHEGYVEPFGGAMSVLLQKPPSKYEVYNDADQEVVGFFRVLRERPDDLVRAVALTPFSRAEVDLACAPQDGTLDDVERARRLYVRAWQSIHGAPARGQMGWRHEITGASKRRNLDTWNTAPESLRAVAARLKAVQIECDDAFGVIPRFDRPGTLFYVDPPYVASTRGERWATCAYKHELGDAGHARLAAVLGGLQGMAVLSGYDCPLYDDLYTRNGWQKVTRPHTTQASQTVTECLWLSPNAQRRAPLLALAAQMDLTTDTEGAAAG